MANLSPAPGQGKPPRRKNPRALRAVSPPDGERPLDLASIAYAFDAFPQELRRLHTLSDEAKLLMSVVVNDCRFLATGGQCRKTKRSNRWLMDQCGWYVVKADRSKSFNDKKLARVFKELEAAQLLRRDLKLDGEKKRGAIHLTWEPTERIDPEDVADIRPPDQGVGHDGDVTDPPNGGSRPPDQGGGSPIRSPDRGIDRSPVWGSSEELSEESIKESPPVPPFRGGGTDGEMNKAVVVDDASASAQGRGVVAPAGWEEDEYPDVGGPIESRSGVRFPVRPMEAGDDGDELDEDEEQEQTEGEDDAGIGLRPGMNLVLPPREAAEVLRSLKAQSRKPARSAERSAPSVYKPTGEEQVGGGAWNREYRERKASGTLAGMRDWPYPHWAPDGHEAKLAAIAEARGRTSPPQADAGLAPTLVGHPPTGPDEGGPIEDDTIADAPPGGEVQEDDPTEDKPTTSDPGPIGAPEPGTQ